MTILTDFENLRKSLMRWCAGQDLNLQPSDPKSEAQV